MLVYVEYFTRFGTLPRGVTGLFTVSHSKRNGKRETAVIPMQDIWMSCQLAPHWKHKDTVTAMEMEGPSVDLLESATSFQFNIYSSPFMFQHYYEWKM